MKNMCPNACVGYEKWKACFMGLVPSMKNNGDEPGQAA
jgi:hypothetical protein